MMAVGECAKKSDTENVLHANLFANVKGLDPVSSSDVYSGIVCAQIYESLLSYHYLKRPLQLVPSLAAEMPKVSKDGLTHTFKIKKGIRFQDSEAFPGGKGREVVANDFIYSWKRLADPANQSEGFWIFDNRVVGLNEWRDQISKGKATYDTPIEGFQAPDDYTIVIKLKAPYFQLHYVLTMNYSAVVPKEAIAKYGKEFLNHPVGTGPYKFETWIRNGSITLVKNPNWLGENYPSEGEPTDAAEGLLADAGKKLPFVDKVVFTEIIEDQPAWMSFMKGQIDFISPPKDNFDTAIKNQKLTDDFVKKGIQMRIVTEPDVAYTSFNMDDPLFKNNPNLRKAIGFATDTKSYIEKFYSGQGIDAQSLIPPDVDGYDPNFKNPYKEYNVAKAKEFLKKAGYPEGKGLAPLEYAVTNSSTARQGAELFKQNMEAIGIQVKVLTSSWPQFQDKIRQKKAQIFGLAWIGDYPDAENFLQLLFGPNQSPGPNNANYKNPEFDKLYKKAALMPPGDERTKVYKQMRDLAVEDAPWIFGAHRLGFYLNHGWVKNYKRYPMIYDYFKYLRVDTGARSELKAKL